MLEEAKLTSKNIKNIGRLRLSIGFLDEECTIFLAENVIPAVFENKEHEIEQVKKFSFSKVLSMIKKDKIVDGLTVGAVLKASTLLGLT